MKTHPRVLIATTEHVFSSMGDTQTVQQYESKVRNIGFVPFIWSDGSMTVILLDTMSATKECSFAICHTLYNTFGFFFIECKVTEVRQSTAVITADHFHYATEPFSIRRETTVILDDDVDAVRFGELGQPA